MDSLRSSYTSNLHARIDNILSDIQYAQPQSTFGSAIQPIQSIQSIQPFQPIHSTFGSPQSLQYNRFHPPPDYDSDISVYIIYLIIGLVIGCVVCYFVMSTSDTKSNDFYFSDQPSEDVNQMM